MGDCYKYLIAKNDSNEHKWLPLWVHCSDTYHVMTNLLNYWFIDGALYAVTESIPSDQVKKIALFLAVFHDYGKSSITFQAKIAAGSEELLTLLDQVGLNTPSVNDAELRNGKEMPHGVAGEILLLLKRCPTSLAAIIGAHHGRPWHNGPVIAQEIEDILEEDEEDIYRNFNYGLRLWGGKARKKEWIKAQDDFYKWALDEIGLDTVRNLPQISDSAAVILAGLVIMADWLASNEEYFPLITYDQATPQNMKDRADYAWNHIRIPPVWRPAYNKDFRALSKERFGFVPNESQEKMIEAVINSEEPGLFILEAPMGVGKTEAALLAAEEFSENRVAGMMFALPTQATANGIFSRILKWGEEQAEHNSLSIRLAHGMAAMNEEYTNLIDSGKHAECLVDDYENNSLIVHDFFQGSKQALLADFVVGTIDQVLLASLKQKHFMLRHLGLCGKVVIIDECHAYDAYMNEYLERTLQWLGAYRTPVIMLSATLPYDRRAQFVDAYLGVKKRNEEADWRKSMGYPLLTWTDEKGVHQNEIPYYGINKNVEIKKIGSADKMPEQLPMIVNILSESLSGGGCAAVIVNTVRRAQELTHAIKKSLPEKHVILLHSRFIPEDRIEYENELLKYAGKGSTRTDRDGLIVIGTQVIEQSLDFDVDLMITDLCPMDLLLQRIGRLHRHSVHDNMRPDSLKRAKCYVLGTGHNLEKGSKAVYGSYLLMRTNSFLPEDISLPKDIAVLVQNVYDEAHQMSEEPEGYYEAREDNNNKKAIAIKNADAFRLIQPGKEKTINRFLEASVLADEDQARAQVRNGNASVEVIVLFSTDEVLTRAPWRYDDSFDPSVCPPSDFCRAISNQKVSLPGWVSDVISIKELVMPTEWEKSVWLRGKHLLILNEKGKAEVGKLIIKYDHYYGLGIERNKE